MTRIRIRWSALRDGIAHAHVHERDMRTVCGQAAVAERNAWPTFRRCLACRALVEEAETGVSESEMRMLWGDR
jgi:hypothetical protein